MLRRQPDELERPVVLLERLGEPALELQDEHLAAVEVVEHALQLQRVAAALDGVGRQVRRGAAAAACERVQHAGAVALDGVAEDHEDLRVRRRARDQARRPDVAHVARRPVAGHLAGLAREGLVVARDVGVRHRRLAEPVEEVLFLAPVARQHDARVIDQEPLHPCGAGPLRADADEVRRAGDLTPLSGIERAA